MGRRAEPGAIELGTLPADVAWTLEQSLNGQEIVLTRDGETVGTLTAAPVAMEGVVLPSVEARPTQEHREGVAVVATAMKLSAGARQRLSEELGDDYVVLDLVEAPRNADVLLVHPVSPQLLGALQGMFPQARVIVAEIEDPELGVSYTGPVARAMGAGAEAYLSPRSIDRLGQALGNILNAGGAYELGPGRARTPETERSEDRRIGLDPDVT